jgi:carboxymethylenebutenolidase
MWRFLLLFICSCTMISCAAGPAMQGTASPPGAVVSEAVDAGFTSAGSTASPLKIYYARPKNPGELPGLIIIHENRGLTPHIQDVARRYANRGFLVVAPDMLSHLGGTSSYATQDEAVTAIGTLKTDGVLADLDATYGYLSSRSDVKKDKIAVLGYCWGGGNSLLYSTKNRSLRAAVVYYGPNPSNLDDISNINAPVLGLYGADDTRITVNVPALETAMKKYNKQFEYKIYDGAAHAFFNDTGERYNLAAAQDAWTRTVSFLEKYLK